MLSRRCDLIKAWVIHDTWISVDLKCLNPRLAISFALILGPVFVVAIVVLAISLSVAPRGAKPFPSWPMSLQESSHSRRDLIATLLVVHLLIVHRVNSGCLRAYGTVAYGAATGRTKPSEALSLWPT